MSKKRAANPDIKIGLETCLLGVVVSELVELLRPVGLDGVESSLQASRFGWKFVLTTAAEQTTSVTVEKNYYFTLL